MGSRLPHKGVATRIDNQNSSRLAYKRPEQLATAFQGSRDQDLPCAPPVSPPRPASRPFTTVHWGPYTLHPAPCTLHPTPYARHPTPCTLYPTSYTLHPAPYTLHSTPCTLQPAPYTLHPAPCTLSPENFKLQKWTDPCEGWTFLVKGNLAHKKQPPPRDHHRSIDIGLL